MCRDPRMGRRAMADDQSFDQRAGIHPPLVVGRFCGFLRRLNALPGGWRSCSLKIMQKMNGVPLMVCGIDRLNCIHDASKAVAGGLSASQRAGLVDAMGGSGGAPWSL